MIYSKERYLPQYFGRLQTAQNIFPEAHQTSGLLLNGDLKHVLRSVNPFKTQNFTLLDSNAQVQGRNILLLHLLFTHSNIHLAVKSFVQVTYSLYLESDVHDYLMESLTSLIDTENEFLSQNKILKRLWKAWRNISFKLSRQIYESRNFKIASITSTLSYYYDKIQKLKELEAATHWYNEGIFFVNENIIHSLRCINPTLTCLNPLKDSKLDVNDDETLWIKKLGLENEELVYAPHGLDSPFQDWNLSEVLSSSTNQSKYLDSYGSHISALASSTRRAYDEASLTIHLIVSSLDNISNKCSKNQFFDVIDTGGIFSDVFGIFPTLQNTFSLLKNNNVSYIITHHRLWSLYKKPFSVFLFQELGVKLKNEVFEELSTERDSDSIFSMRDPFLKSLLWLKRNQLLQMKFLSSSSFSNKYDDDDDSWMLSFEIESSRDTSDNEDEESDVSNYPMRTSSSKYGFCRRETFVEENKRPISESSSSSFDSVFNSKELLGIDKDYISHKFETKGYEKYQMQDKQSESEQSSLLSEERQRQIFQEQFNPNKFPITESSETLRFLTPLKKVKEPNLKQTLGSPNLLSLAKEYFRSDGPSSPNKSKEVQNTPVPLESYKEERKKKESTGKLVSKYVEYWNTYIEEYKEYKSISLPSNSSPSFSSSSSFSKC